MKKLLVTGANGQVASEYQMSPPLKGWDYFFLTREELDITSIRKVQKVFRDIVPDAVLNLAAHTNVERAEKEEISKAFDVNAIGPKNLAICCKKLGIPLVHISTDYVFDGEKPGPYTEEDLENPLNQYGRTKFLGEKWVQESCDWYYILRVSWIYSNHSKNFFTTMLNLAQERSEVNVVDDQFGSPTSAKEICRAVDKVLENLDPAKTGVYHFCGLGRTTWKDFTSEIFSQTGLNVKVNGVPTSSWNSRVIRPSNSYMSSEKFGRTFNYFPAHWKNSLKEVISERKIVPVKVGDVVIMKGEPYVIVSTDWLKLIARISKSENLENSVEIPFQILTLP